MSVLEKVGPKRYAELREIARKLIGTTGGEIEDEVNELTLDECKLLDTMAFRCKGCEWWLDKNECVEINMNWYCVQCAPDVEVDPCVSRL